MKDLESREDIELLVKSFYDKVIRDEVIGYIFNDVAKVDWDHHLPIMYNFWESILFGKDTYLGNPMAVHIRLDQKENLKPEHFERWLELFQKTVDEHFSGATAEMAKLKAGSIAGVMQAKVNFHRNSRL